MMNKILETYARNWLRENIQKLSQGSVDLFKRIYGDGEINDVIDKMDVKKLDWAMQQVENTLKKNKI